MRALLEQLGGRLMRVRAYHRESANVIAGIVNTALGHLLSFSQRTAHRHNRSVMALDPRLPGRESLAFHGADARAELQMLSIPVSAVTATERSRGRPPKREGKRAVKSTVRLLGFKTSSPLSITRVPPS